MDSQLAYDLLELIVRKVDAQHKSTLATLCLTARVFSPSAQKRLYEALVIDTATKDQTAVQTRTLLARSIQENPGLVSFVQRVTCIVENPADNCRLTTDLEQIMTALGKMQNIASFSLRSAFQGIYLFDRAPAVWRETFLAICDNPKLRELELTHIMNFPSHVLLLAYNHLETLSLLDCIVGIYGAESQEEFERMHKLDATLVGRQSLKRLFCDYRSWRYLNGLVAWGQDQAFNTYDLVFQAVEKLDVVGIDHRPQALLSQSTSLREANLILLTPSPEPILDPFPLDSLNAASFQTLCRLEIKAYLDCLDYGLAQNADPYLGLCKKALPELIALQKISLKIDFGGSAGSMMPYLQSFAGPQWGQLDGVLSVPGRFPKLQRVELAVIVMILAGEDNVLQEIKAAELMMQSMDDHIFPRQFQGLLDRQAGELGDFSLSFQKAIELVPIEVYGVY